MKLVFFSFFLLDFHHIICIYHVIFWNPAYLGCYKKSLRSRSARGSFGFLGLWFASPGESWWVEKNVSFICQTPANFLSVNSSDETKSLRMAQIIYRCSWCGGPRRRSSHPSIRGSHHGLSHHGLPHHGLHHWSSRPPCSRLPMQQHQHSFLFVFEVHSNKSWTVEIAVAERRISVKFQVSSEHSHFEFN